MAAVGGSVTILHNGLREKVSFDKTYPLLTALEIYCRKYGLDASKYVLLSGRTPVDMGTPFQFSSVPNNAMLELSLRTGGVDPGAMEVKVALERPPTTAPAGTTSMRLEGLFYTKATIADVLLSFIRSGDLLPGVDETALTDSKFEGFTVIYVRRPVKGAEITTASLASLGAIKGTASLRLAEVPAPILAAVAGARAASGGASGGAGDSSSAAAVGGGGAASSASTPASTTQAAPTGDAVAASSTGPGATVTTGTGSNGSSTDEEPSAKRARTSDGTGDETSTSTGTGTGSASGAVGATASGGASAPASSSSEATPSSTVTPVIPQAASASSSSGGASEDNVMAGSTGSGVPSIASAPAHAPITRVYSASGIGAAMGLEPDHASASSSSAGASGGASASGDAQSLKTVGVRVRRAVERLRAGNFDVDSRACVATMVRILDNLIKTPFDPRIRTLRSSNAKFQAAVGRHPAAIEILKAVGFVERGAGGEWVIGEESEDDERTLLVREILQAAAIDMGDKSLPPAPEIDYHARERAAQDAAKIAAAFDPYKPAILTTNAAAPPPGTLSSLLQGGAASGGAAGSSAGAFGGAAGGSSAHHPEAPPRSFSIYGDAGAASSSSSASSSSASSSGIGSGLSSEELAAMTGVERRVMELRRKAEDIQAANRPADRASLVTLYTPPAPRASSASSSGGAAGGAGASSSSSSAAGGGSDDSTGPADPEEQRMLAEYAKKKMQEMNTDKPIKTRAQRELELLQAAKIFTTALVRVEMPDRTVMQGTFSPLDTTATLHEWVRSLLHPSLEATPFYLYSSPPVQQHTPSPTTTLAAAKLVPAKLLRFAWGTGPSGRLAPDAVPSAPEGYLHPDAFAAATSGVTVESRTHATIVADAGHPAGVDLATATVGVLPSTTGGAASAGMSDLTDEELDKMARVLMGGGNPMTARATAGGAASSAAGRSAAASGTGAKASGGAGASSGGKPGGKPAWLKL